MVPKLGYVLQLIQTKTAEHHPKPFLDDISPTSGERERLENGTGEARHLPDASNVVEPYACCCHQL
jgi:hypothetical protein